jgi:chorismate dehydratase
MASTPLRCGRISYTNDLPVYAAFDAGAVEFPGTLRVGVPAELNRAMLAGDLDCGPISSFFFAQHADEFALLPGVCIGSRAAVRSIYCMSKAELRSLAGTPISVTTESATGRALFDVICRSRFGFAPSYVESEDPLRDYRELSTPAVLIGDKAIDAALFDPEHAHDLGTLWHGFTSADMVYAVWAIRRDAAAASPGAATAVAAALTQSLDWGLANLDAAISAAEHAIPRPEGFYAAYYRGLNFRFDERAQDGLRAFFDACTGCGLLDRTPALVFLDEELERV